MLYCSSLTNFKQKLCEQVLINNVHNIIHLIVHENIHMSDILDILKCKQYVTCCYNM